MEKLISLAVLILFGFVACFAQIKNATTEIVHIQGNCEMCEATIENAGNVKNISMVEWNKDTQMATLTYDVQKTSQDKILKRIALAGYDNPQFFAPDEIYAQLPAYCQYERVNKSENLDNMGDHSMTQSNDLENKAGMMNQDVDPLQMVFDNYFALKDALVASDGTLASVKAEALLTALNAVKMEKLAIDLQMIWVKVMNDLNADAMQMSRTKDIEKQRTTFITLSKNVYELIKVSKVAETVYYQFCPMADDGKGANWLSRENAVKNPYYGSMMLSCGKTVETIEKQ
jgi:copper chaperone CopZ